MYVAVKGGEAAILQSYRLLDAQRRGNATWPELSVAQIREQLKLAVDRVMTEGSVYDPDLAALAIKQACGDMVEAIFLLRAYRATLPRLGYSLPLETERMRLDRRISATFKDLPGGQVLGPTYDYTQRLLDFSLMAEAQAEGLQAPGPQPGAGSEEPDAGAVPRVVDWLNQEGLIEPQQPPEGDPEPGDLTREPLHFPADRPLPVDSFWSLSLYESTPDGQFFFVDNPLGRYAIGDRTPGLTLNEDGSLDIWIGHESPGAERESNWLPAPAGPFALFMRAYLPRPELLDGRYRLPPVTEA
jgi:hypothetical protein